MTQAPALYDIKRSRSMHLYTRLRISFLQPAQKSLDGLVNDTSSFIPRYGAWSMLHLAGQL